MSNIFLFFALGILVNAVQRCKWLSSRNSQGLSQIVQITVVGKTPWERRKATALSIIIIKLGDDFKIFRNTRITGRNNF